MLLIVVLVFTLEFRLVLSAVLKIYNMHAVWSNRQKLFCAKLYVINRRRWFIDNCIFKCIKFTKMKKEMKTYILL